MAIAQATVRTMTRKIYVSTQGPAVCPMCHQEIKPNEYVRIVGLPDDIEVMVRPADIIMCHDVCPEVTSDSTDI